MTQAVSTYLYLMLSRSFKVMFSSPEVAASASWFTAPEEGKVSRQALWGAFLSLSLLSSTFICTCFPWSTAVWNARNVYKFKAFFIRHCNKCWDISNECVHGHCQVLISLLQATTSNRAWVNRQNSLLIVNFLSAFSSFCSLFAPLCMRSPDWANFGPPPKDEGQTQAWAVVYPPKSPLFRNPREKRMDGVLHARRQGGLRVLPVSHYAANIEMAQRNLLGIKSNPLQLSNGSSLSSSVVYPVTCPSYSTPSHPGWGCTRQ